MTTFIPSLTLPSQVFAQPATSILLPLLLGNGVGFIVAPKEAQSTYMALKQPPYRPPPQVFAPVWTALYGLMGYAAYRAYNTGMSLTASPNQVLAMKVSLLFYAHIYLTHQSTHSHSHHPPKMRANVETRGFLSFSA